MIQLPPKGPPLFEQLAIVQIQQQAETNRLLARLVDALYQQPDGPETKAATLTAEAVATWAASQ